MNHTTLPLEEFLSNREAIIVDVRTPAEYALGHLPHAHNLPLFSDEERAIVGTLYKQVGKEAAVLRGLELVGSKLAHFVREATQMAKGNEIYLYCWRGGMRSNSMAWLLNTAGLKASVLEGGYKAYRSAFDEWVARPWQFVVLHGKTGCGKTDILQALAQRGEQVLDLEGLAHHKGSVFGGMGQREQPSTESFINYLHEALREFDLDRPIWCEGESMLIGHVYIPQNLFDKLSSASVIEIDLAMEARIARLVKEYGGFGNELLIPAFERIRKRLGFDNVKIAIAALEEGDVATAATIALRYYDKGYTLSGEKRSGAVIDRLWLAQDDAEAAAERLIELYYTTQNS